MTDDKDCSTRNSTKNYRLNFSGCDDISAELLRFFDAIIEATNSAKKRECAAFKKFKPEVIRVATTHALRPPSPIVSHISTTHRGAHSSSGKADKHERTK